MTIPAGVSVIPPGHRTDRDIIQVYSLNRPGTSGNYFLVLINFLVVYFPAK